MKRLQNRQIFDLMFIITSFDTPLYIQYSETSPTTKSVGSARGQKQRPPCVKGAVSRKADWGIDRQPLRHGFAAPPPLTQWRLILPRKKAPPTGGALRSSRQQPPKMPHSSFSREAQSKLQNISVTSLVWIRSCKNTVIIPRLPPRCKCNACQKWEA